MPREKQRIKLFRYKTTPDSFEEEKFAFIDIQFLSCAFIALSLGGSLIAILQMSSLMTGFTGGIYATDNFEFAVVSLQV